MYNTSPRTVESSIGTYMVYYTSLSHFEWDPKTEKRKKISFYGFVSNFSRFLIHFHLLSVVLSFAMHFDYKPFQSKVDLHEYHFNADILSPGHLGNAYVLALLTYLVLATAFELAAVGENLKGFKTKSIFLNPMFASRSPTDFWSRRWNMTIHRLLKHGVFLPARQFFPLPIAVALTFLGSGLLHDYSWTVIFYKPGHLLDEHGFCEGCFVPILFKVSCFFLWNAVIMILEKKVGHLFGFTKSWPTIVVSTLVVLTALPVSHWFTGDWAIGGLYADYAIGLWHIRKL